MIVLARGTFAGRHRIKTAAASAPLSTRWSKAAVRRKVGTCEYGHRSPRPTIIDSPGAKSETPDGRRSRKGLSAPFVSSGKVLGGQLVANGFPLHPLDSCGDLVQVEPVRVLDHGDDQVAIALVERESNVSSGVEEYPALGGKGGVCPRMSTGSCATHATSQVDTLSITSRRRASA